MNRIPPLLYGRSHICDSYDLQDRSTPRQKEPPHLPLDLLYCRLRFRHVREGLWYCAEAHLRRKQPVHPCLNIHIHDSDSVLHSYSNELFQQGTQPVQHTNVRSFKLDVKLVHQADIYPLTELTPFTM